jgi:hypothetical protein|tara:strand:+ start:378 stop:1142 length:765 start_codon:yes stop_codon:yes gene_type:complete
MAKKEKTAPAVWEQKDRVYELVGNKKPIITTIPAKHSVKRSLLWFDPEKGYQRELRYATNQSSPFVDEQKGEVTLEQIVFRNGTLFVPKANVALQKLLSLYHPLNGGIYYEVDNVKQANDDLAYLEAEIEALNSAKNLDIDHLEAILRVEVGSKVNSMTSKEIKRDVLLFARRNPILFLELASDDNVQLRNFGIKAVEDGIIDLSQDQRNFTWASTGRKLLSVPFEENPYSALAAWFKTDEGVEIYSSIEKRLK